PMPLPDADGALGERHRAPFELALLAGPEPGPEAERDPVLEPRPVLPRRVLGCFDRLDDRPPPGVGDVFAAGVRGLGRRDVGSGVAPDHPPFHRPFEEVMEGGPDALAVRAGWGSLRPRGLVEE